MVFVFPRIWLKDEACLCFFCIKIPYNGQESNHQALLSRKNINISQVDFMIEWEFGVCQMFFFFSFFFINHNFSNNQILIRLFRIISIPSKFCYFRQPDHVISMECKASDYRCQCTQQKLQSTCAVLTFDPRLKKILTFSIKDRYQILVTVTQSVTNVPQTNNTSTSGMNEEQCENISRNNQSPVFDSIISIVWLLCYATLQCATINQ